MINKIFSFSMFLPFAVACVSTPSEENQKPNIIFLLADDMGYAEPGCYGQEVIKTPFLDSLAGLGMRFTDFYAGSAVCSPSRAVLMTGKHAGHATIRGNKGKYPDGKWYRVPLEMTEITLGEMLRSAGYQTGFVGKWHMEDPDSLETWAISRGFDYVVQEQWSETREGAREFDETVHWRNGWSDSVPYVKEDWDCIDVFRTNLAMDFLDRREKDKPFFLFMSYRTPHGHERFTRNKELYADKGWDDAERRHAARITMLDEQMRRLFLRLEKDGDLENTLVLFTSDNGPTNEGHSYEFFNSNGDLRGFKRDMYEGGIRVPMIAFWKNKIKPGTTTPFPFAFYDIMPTLAEAASIPKPDVTDGISFLPTLFGKDQIQHEYLYWEILELMRSPDGGFRQAVRMGKWKGVRYGVNSAIEVYNLEEDLGEQNNLAEQYPEIASKLVSIMEEARTPSPFFPYGGTVPKDSLVSK